MATPLRFASLLLLSTALTAPAAFAQTNGAESEAPDAAAPGDATAGDAPAEEEQAPEISVPGGDIVVVGRRGANVQRASAAVVSVLSTADIARTGEGNIAGALGRVTGLSVVGNGFVYVRGLGDRYSLALLNGSPLPSPEPLKRVVPLDLFPTNIVSSSLVQKSYSPNFPGEFGGGVINLTTSAVPKDDFLTISTGGGYHSETTGIQGYSYFGSSTDWTGFDNGSRNTPSPLASFLSSGKRVLELTNAENRALAGSLVTSRNGLVQRLSMVQPNFSASVSGGASIDVGDAVLGLIATAGYTNRWTNRDAIQQRSVNSDLSQLDSDFERVTTDNRIVVNGLVGVGLEWGDNKIRWTSLYIRDTLKNTRLGIGQKREEQSDYNQQDTAWYERQLIDTQLVGEYKLTPDLSLDLRASYANSQREAPAEFSAEYIRSNETTGYGPHFINRLDGGTTSDARIRYSDLEETLWSGGADVTYKLMPDLGVSVGYAYTRTTRLSSRREFRFRFQVNPATPGLGQASPSQYEGIGLLRPDLLLAPNIVEDFIILEDLDPNPTFRAKLRTHAGYGKFNWQVTPEVMIDAGVRYEKATQSVVPVQVFNTGNTSTAITSLKNSYWLPAATITWQVQPEMQLRVNASKTIARPQFRELIFQQYFDPDTNRLYRGNSLLTDSELINGEIRYEWYFARDQRLSVAGFYKKIDRPIESYITVFGSDIVTSFANAPSADLYGAEFEVQKYFDMANWSDAALFSTRRLVTIANYTYTKSKLKVGASDTTGVFGASGAALASDYFKDGASLTGQSDHLINFQLGMEDTDKLSQQTLILSYASKRVTSRGLNNSGQPDILEYPGFNLDFVWRQGVTVAGRDLDLKFEARNITYNKYKETQSNGTNTIIYNQYDRGTTFNISVSTTF
jgi:outer membrane receptor protein involved in Fe transport